MEHSDAEVAAWLPPHRLAHAIASVRAHPVLDVLGGWRGLEAAIGVANGSISTGIATASLASRMAHFGRNYVAPPRPKSLLRLMMESAFLDRTNLMLLGAGLVSLLLGVLIGTHPMTDWVEGTCVLVAVTAIVLVTALTEYKKERQFQDLNAVKNNPLVHVVRDDGSPMEVPMWDLVVGDVVVLHTGDVIPADGMLLSSRELRVDESAMTGEAEPVRKHWESEKRNVVLGGTTVMEGSGSMVVLAVGEYTQEGQILRIVHGKTIKESPPTKVVDEQPSQLDSSGFVALVTPGRENIREPDQEDNEEAQALDRTPLALKLEQLNLTMGKIGSVIALVLFGALSTKFSIEQFVIQKKPWSSDALSQYVNFFILAVTTLVVSIPEGLPLAVMLALTYSVRRMLREKSLVRHLYACETAGNATIICSDKTGTLTTNEMAVTALWLGGSRDITSTAQLIETVADSKVVDLVMQSMAINSSAELLDENNSTGSPTDSALLRFVQAAGVDYAASRASVVIERMVPFSSDRKCMTTVIKSQNQPGRLVVFTKGAPERVLSRCARTAWDVVGDASLDSRGRDAIMASVVQRYASRGCRTLCLAYKEVSTASVAIHEVDEIESDLVLLAVVAMEDPIRPEVPRAIELCKSAGVAVCMVTGDNLVTASAIARQCGILADPHHDTLEAGSSISFSVLHASDFRERVTNSNGSLNQREFDLLWPTLRVLARATPHDKYLLVTGLMATQNPSSQLVAVTGDGTNDAAALKKAHIGFAMGRGGTEVAKRASDIVVLDDNFMSIVNAIKWGRNVYDSIAKFLQFQLTMIVVAVTMAVGSALFMDSPALTAVQILWVNLFMDAFVSLGLATETPTDNVMKRAPYSRDEPLLSRKMRKHVVGQVLFQLLVLILRAGCDWPISTEQRWMVTSNSNRPTVRSTMVFNTFAWLQLFNQINCRRIDDELNVFAGLVHNNFFVGGWILQALLQFVAIQYGGTLFHAVSLNGEQWAVCLGIAALSLPWGFALRALKV